MARSLDPQTAKMQEARASLRMKPLGEMTVDEARNFSKQMIAANTAVKEPVAHVEDRTIPGPIGEIPIRVYRPDGAGPFGIFVYLHGGGWVIGSLDTVDHSCRAVANQANCVVVSVDYRMAPEFKFPAPVEDCYAAVAWVAAHAEELKGDANRIAVGGDSAGGNLTIAVCLLARDRNGPRIAQQIPIYPVTNAAYDTPAYQENGAGYGLDLDAMKFFWNHYLRDEADASNPLASPMRAESLAGLPPALVLTAEFDPLRDEGEAYGAKLWESGVPAVVIRYRGVTHGFFTGATVLDAGKHAVLNVSTTLRDAFKEVPVPAAV